MERVRITEAVVTMFQQNWTTLEAFMLLRLDIT